MVCFHWCPNFRRKLTSLVGLVKHSNRGLTAHVTMTFTCSLFVHWISMDIYSELL